MHYSVKTEDMPEALTKLVQVGNIINARHRVTKEPLNLFFIDLEPTSNNRHIYNVKQLQNNISIETPNKNKKYILRYMRCQ